MTQRAAAKRPIGIDLFAGAGGFSLGFEQAGFDVAAAVEIDPIHAATHAYNFPRCAPIVRSVVGLTGDEIKTRARVRGSIDVIFGGAPCQGFSLIGQRALDDPRNVLVREFVRLVSELDSKYFVFENVKGLTMGPHRKFLDELIGEFADVGYRVVAPWRVLNASSYGVPQDRERLILIGARRDMPLPRYPEPTSVAPTMANTTDPRRGPTCTDALGDLPNADDFDELMTVDAVRTTAWRTPSAYARPLRGERDKDDLSYPRIWDQWLLSSSLRTEHTPISRRRFAATTPGEVEPISRFFRLPPNGVSNTLRAGTDSARGAFTSPRPVHYAYPRCITVREMARLHGFPDWFRLHKTKWHGARQVGNAVPAPLARAVAGEIAHVLGKSIEQPTEVIAMGSETLLGLDMRDAAELWGVPVVIGRRNRKSGMKKRKQADIERDLLAASSQ